MKPGETHKQIAKLLDARLASLVKVNPSEQLALNLVACTDIYTTVFETLVEVIEEAQIPIDNEAMNYLAQSYYDGVLINGRQELDPDIFSQRAKLENIETKQLALLAVILFGTDFVKPIIEEVKRRA
jgi:hypothetical protein